MSPFIKPHGFVANFSSFGLILAIFSSLSVFLPCLAYFCGVSYWGKSRKPQIESDLSFDKILLNSCKSSFKSKNITQTNFDKTILDLVKDSVDEQSQFNMAVNENQVIAKAISFSLGDAPYGMLCKVFTELINSKYLISVDGGYATDNNKIIVQNSRGKASAISVTKLAKKVNSNEVQIYQEKQINIATGDLLRLPHSNKNTDFLGLAINKSYRVVGIDKKYCTLHDRNRLISIFVSNSNAVLACTEKLHCAIYFIVYCFICVFKLQL